MYSLASSLISPHRPGKKRRTYVLRSSIIDVEKHRADAKPPTSSSSPDRLTAPGSRNSRDALGNTLEGCASSLGGSKSLDRLISKVKRIHRRQTLAIHTPVSRASVVVQAPLPLVPAPANPSDNHVYRAGIHSSKKLYSPPRVPSTRVTGHRGNLSDGINQSRADDLGSLTSDLRSTRITNGRRSHESVKDKSQYSPPISTTASCLPAYGYFIVHVIVNIYIYK